MRLVRFAFLTFAATVLASCAMPAPSCVWDESYGRVIAEAAPGSKYGNAETSRQELKTLAGLLATNPERKALFKQSTALGNADEQVRVEAIYPMPGAYRAVWIIRSKGIVTMLAAGRAGIRQTRLSGGRMEEVEALFQGARLRSWLNRRVEDGEAYFVSFSVPGRCGQYALYAPILSSVMSEADRVFDRQIATEKRIVEDVFRMGLGER